MPHTGKTATCRCAYTTAALTIWVSWPGRIGISERLRRRQNQHGAPLQKLLGEPLQLAHDSNAAALRSSCARLMTCAIFAVAIQSVPPAPGWQDPGAAVLTAVHRVHA